MRVPYKHMKWQKEGFYILNCQKMKGGGRSSLSSLISPCLPSVIWHGGDTMVRGPLDRRDCIAVIALNRRRGSNREAVVASKSRCPGRLKIALPWSPFS